MLVNSRRNWGKSFIVQTSFGLKRCLPKLSNLLLLFIFISVALAPLRALAEPCEQWVAKAVSVEGTVEAKSAGETGWQQVKPDDTFCAGDMVRVLEESRADLAFANQPLLRLDQNSAITLGAIRPVQGCSKA
jgi:hypothetical protein